MFGQMNHTLIFTLTKIPQENQFHKNSVCPLHSGEASAGAECVSTLNDHRDTIKSSYWEVWRLSFNILKKIKKHNLDFPLQWVDSQQAAKLDIDAWSLPPPTLGWEKRKGRVEEIKLSGQDKPCLISEWTVEKERKITKVMQSRSFTNSHRQNDDQPVPEQKVANGSKPRSTPIYCWKWHYMVWNMSLASSGHLPGCVPSQLSFSL